MYVTATALPGAAVMTLAGGAVFGLLWGTVVFSFCEHFGRDVVFLGARWLLRDWVSTKFRATYDPCKKVWIKKAPF